MRVVSNLLGVVRGRDAVGAETSSRDGAEAGPRLVVLVGRMLELGQGVTEQPEAPVSGAVGHGEG